MSRTATPRGVPTAGRQQPTGRRVVPGVAPAAPVTGGRSTRRAPVAARPLHPWAWWVWALGTAAALSLTTNLLLLGLGVAAVLVVVLARRSSAPWARSVRAYLLLALSVLGLRVVFQVLLGSSQGTALFTLPSITLPGWLAGLRIGGPVGADMLLFTVTDGLRLASILVCVGAANTLANPRRALRHVPSALHEVSTALVIALSVAPLLVESGQRVRLARRLRGGSPRGLRGFRSLVVPVLEDAIDRSMSLAGSMEARGYGRTRSLPPLGRTTTALLLGGMLALVMAAFCLLGVPGGGSWAGVLGLAGLLAVAIGLRLSGRRLAVSHYRPDPWRVAETATACCGAGALAVALWLQHTAGDVLSPPASPAAWPQLHPAMLVLAMLVLLPAFVTPPPGAES